MCWATIAMKWDRLSQSCLRALAHQAQERFIHQSRGLQGVPGPLAPQVGGSQPAQFTIDDPGHLGQSRLVALPPIPQQDRHREELRSSMPSPDGDYRAKNLRGVVGFCTRFCALRVQRDMQTLSNIIVTLSAPLVGEKPALDIVYERLQERAHRARAGGVVRRLERSAARKNPRPGRHTRAPA